MLMTYREKVMSFNVCNWRNKKGKGTSKPDKM